MLISTQPELNEFCERLRLTAESGAPLAFDTEFVSEKRYFARLCLVQVFMPSQEPTLQQAGVTHGEYVEGAIDPFHLDLMPLAELVGDKDILKIVHAGASDLHIFWENFGIEPKNIFDTQIAAAFLGFGHQVGYADLVRKITGVTLSKNLQYSDWSARPLSSDQIEYAMSDVRHLPALFADLKSDLARRNRLSWARTEFRRAEERAAAIEDDDSLYKRLNMSGLKRQQLAILREVAMLREQIARDLDKPPSFIVPDLALIQMVRQPPRDPATMRSIRGMPAVPNENARRFIEAVEFAQKLPIEEWPQARPEERPDPRLDSIVALLGVVAGARATANDVSRTYLAPREQLSTLGAWWLKMQRGIIEERPELPLLTDWRGEIMGDDLLRLLDGELVVAMDGATGLPEIVERVMNNAEI